jgi:hypothetical protein
LAKENAYHECKPHNRHPLHIHLVHYERRTALLVADATIQRKVFRPWFLSRCVHPTPHNFYNLRVKLRTVSFKHDSAFEKPPDMHCPRAELEERPEQREEGLPLLSSHSPFKKLIQNICSEAELDAQDNMIPMARARHAIEKQIKYVPGCRCRSGQVREERQEERECAWDADRPETPGEYC